MHHGLGIAQLILTGLLWTCVGVVYSHAARHQIRRIPFVLVTNFSTALLAWCLCDWASIRATGVPNLPHFVLPVALGGILNVSGMLLIMAAMRRGHQAGSWTVSQSAMVVPFLAGMVFWGERPAPFNIVGVLLIVSSIALFGQRKETDAAAAESSGWFSLAMSAFVLIGLSQICFTIPSHLAGWTDSGRLRVPVLCSAAALALSLVCAIRREWPQRRELKTGMACSLVSLAGSVMLFEGMDNLASTGLISLVYPLAVGTCIVGFGLHTRFFLRESLGFAGTLAIGLGVIGVLLLGVK